MNSRTVIVTAGLFLVLGAGFARAQAGPGATAAPSGAPPESLSQSSAAPAESALVYVEKASVVVEGEAQAHGSFTIVFAPQGRTAKPVTVSVLVHAKGKEVARDLYHALANTAGKAYKVKLKDDKVHISKADDKAPNFAVTVERLEVGGVSVRVEKD